jgi:NADPH:quinone reductase-like Zn-dependent oxidoreductase
VVVSAASSSMGVAALQMVRAVGAKSIAVTRSEGKVVCVKFCKSVQGGVVGRGLSFGLNY